MRNRNLQRTIRSALVLVVTVPCLAAAGESLRPYVGLAHGPVSSGYPWASDPRDVGPTSRDSASKLMGGFRPLDNLAVEVAYVDFDDLHADYRLACLYFAPGPGCPPEHNALQTRALAASALGLIDLGRVDLFGRAGLNRWHQRRSEPYAGSDPPEPPVTTSGTDLIVGIGLQGRIRNTTLRLETERYTIGGRSRRLSSVGFTFVFGE